MHKYIKILTLSSIVFLSACGEKSNTALFKCPDNTIVKSQEKCISPASSITIHDNKSVKHLIKKGVILTKDKIKINSVSNLSDISFSKEKNAYFVQVFVSSAPNGYYPVYFLTENDAKRFKDYFYKEKHTKYSAS